MIAFHTIIVYDRYVNGALALICLILLTRAIQGWRRASPGFRFHWSGLWILIFATGWGNVRGLFDRETTGIYVTLSTIGLIYLLIGLTGHRKTD